MQTVMRKHKQCKAKLADWLSLHAFLTAVLDVADLMATLSGWRSVDVSVRLAASVDGPMLRRLADVIEQTVSTWVQQHRSLLCAVPLSHGLRC